MIRVFSGSSSWRGASASAPAERPRSYFRHSKPATRFSGRTVRRPAKHATARSGPGPSRYPERTPQTRRLGGASPDRRGTARARRPPGPDAQHLGSGSAGSGQHGRAEPPRGHAAGRRRNLRGLPGGGASAATAWRPHSAPVHPFPRRPARRVADELEGSLRKTEPSRRLGSRSCLAPGRRSTVGSVPTPSHQPASSSSSTTLSPLTPAGAQPHTPPTAPPPGEFRLRTSAAGHPTRAFVHSRPWATSGSTRCS